MSLPFLATQISGLLSNIMRGACYRTMYVYLFNNSLFIILKFDIAILDVHTAFYSLSSPYLETGPGTCIQLSIGPPW